MAKFLALLVGDGGAQVLDLDQALADEDDLGDFGDAGHPGIADQLRIERKQTLRLFRVAGRSGLPLDQAAGAVQLPDGIDVGDEVILFRNGPRELDLQVASRLAECGCDRPGRTGSAA